ncbi:hypothetical protein [Cellulomonas sp. C5510]|uniref:hypothetical protein n=1 Tax=Cellulomonas sp. C5510 TaxID=2871170 RepID=UPI001C96A4B4|nr:hypothetical protein [Cellulomonas sp. C5510]QZN84279.1 hypothetical protein K5O09_10270 [Cellulomonas sp. C5510]
MNRRSPDDPPGPARLVHPAALASPPRLVRRSDVGDVAWQVLLRDCDLVLLRGDVALPRGVAGTPALRAAALAPEVARREAVARAAAAWVHLGGPPPRRVVVVDRAALGPRDVVRLGGALVTSPARTAVDLLCREPADVVHALLPGLLRGGVDAARLRTRLAATSGHRGVDRGLALLREVVEAPATVRPGAAAGQTSTTGCSALAPVMR